jgi:hypothetical protein
MTEPTSAGWNPCPEGELTRLGAHLAFRRWLRAAAGAGLFLLAAGGVAGAGWLAHSALKSDSDAGGGAPCHPAPCCDGPAAPMPVPPAAAEPPKK